MNTDFQPWIPEPLRRGILFHIKVREKLGCDDDAWRGVSSEVDHRLLNDTRLVPFWGWVENVGIPAMVEEHKKRPAGPPKESDDYIARIKANALLWGIGLCFSEANKVESMVVSERREYFSEVSSAATKLIGLLKGTQFGAGMWDGATWYRLEQAQAIMETDLRSSQQKQAGKAHWRTFFFDHEEDDGVWSMATEYPLNCFTDHLDKLRKWANDPESLGELFSPYTPVKQRGIRGLKNRVLINLARKFRFSEWGTVTIPYEHLAELVNAGLDLPEDEQLNKTSARKQIERYAKERDKS